MFTSHHCGPSDGYSERFLSADISVHRRIFGTRLHSQKTNTICDCILVFVGGEKASHGSKIRSINIFLPCTAAWYSLNSCQHVAHCARAPAGASTGTFLVQGVGQRQRPCLAARGRVYYSRRFVCRARPSIKCPRSFCFPSPVVCGDRRHWWRACVCMYCAYLITLSERTLEN